MESSRVNFPDACVKQFNESASLFLATEQAMILVAGQFSRLGLDSLYKYTSRCAAKVRAKVNLMLDFQAKRGGRFQFVEGTALPEIPDRAVAADAVRLLEWIHTAKQAMQAKLSEAYGVAKQKKDIVSMEFLQENVLGQLSVSIQHVRQHIAGLRNSPSAYLYDPFHSEAENGGDE